MMDLTTNVSERMLQLLVIHQLLYLSPMGLISQWYNLVPRDSLLPFVAPGEMKKRYPGKRVDSGEVYELMKTLVSKETVVLLP